VYLGVTSPAVEVFQAGGVARDLRLRAAQGQACEEVRDRLALLALMTEDEDAEVAALARRTIAAVPADALRTLLAAPDIPRPLVEWYATHASGQPGEVHHEDGHRLLASLPVPERIRIATHGRREQRAVLVRDPNRLVSSAVLASPKLTETEIEHFARMQNVSDEVLRLIGTNRTWTKSYAVVAALVRNPRTPPAVSLALLPRLQERDVKGLTIDRNVPESVRISARKHLAVQQSRRSG
jgi:hypothetical protein